ncbi:hypothetical protein [Denitratisoma sp. agr-D3]
MTTMHVATASSASGSIPEDDFLFFKPRDRNTPIRSTLSARNLATIFNAIHTCWAEIETFPYRKSQPFQSAHLHDEDALSAKLVEILNYKLQKNLIPGFKANQFQDVYRDAKQSNASATSYDQMPDLLFRMIRFAPNEDRSESGLYVECKLVSAGSGCGEYVSNGMYRFVSGRYASQMGFGLMLGYTTQSYSDPDGGLEAYFKLASKAESIKCKATLSSCEIHPNSYSSKHTRASPCAPSFRMFHIWLVRPGVS